MKKKLAIYSALLSLLFVGVSCLGGDDENFTPNPYAYVSSFSIGSIKSEYPEFTSDGEDTLVVQTIAMTAYPFTINQEIGEIYNNDSLPFATNVTKVVVNMGVQGIVSIYNETTGTYDKLYMSDSLDFTTPRKFRIHSLDETYYKDYTVTINVHQVNPDIMQWNEYPAVEGVTPQRALELVDGTMCLFGLDSDGNIVVARTSVNGVPAWEQAAVTGLPAGAELSTVQLFDGRLYVVAGGDLYVSADGVAWSVSATGLGAVAIIGASDSDGELWVAGEQGIMRSTDGVAFEVTEPMPQGLPVYGVSIASYPLVHNSSKIRYMLIGYTNEARDGNVAVWSRLSGEDKWTSFENVGAKYPCPALDGLTVLRYNNSLYAVGGAGVQGSENIGAFSSFYVSKDNGIVWKAPTGFYQRLPQDLLNDESAFAVAVDSRNYIWIINAGLKGGTRKGILNRLGFVKQ